MTQNSFQPPKEAADRVHETLWPERWYTPGNGNNRNLNRKSKGYKDLVVYQRALDMVVAVHVLIAEFPTSMRYSLADQIFRAACSVTLNLSEGYGQNSKRAFRHALGICRGSNNEVEAALAIARRLGFGSQKNLERAEGLNADVGRLLNAYVKSIGSEDV